jgi:hypothetical protein
MRLFGLRRKRKLNRKALKIDDTATQKLADLFYFVNNINKTPDLALRGGVYREIAKADVFSTSFDGWEVGYKLEDYGVFFRRKIFLKCEQPLKEVPHKQINPIMAAVMETFLESGQDMPKLEQISEFAVLLQQDVIPILLTERKPNLVSLGPTGPSKN